MDRRVRWDEGGVTAEGVISDGERVKEGSRGRGSVEQANTMHSVTARHPR